LAEAVRRRPYAVVLLDEIEKAHPEVFNVLLQILDEGRLTDNQGRTVSFKNAIIIMTSNLGAHRVMSLAGGIDDANRATVLSEIRKEIDTLLRDALRPEFLNRIDDIVLFEPLTSEQISEIARLRFEDVRARLEVQGIEVEITNDGIEYLAGAGFDPSFGARPLKRVVNSEIVQPISKEILRGNLKPGNRLTVDAAGDGIIFRVEESPQTVSSTGDD
jgi:ATP-dependent Clp protease ATP-binding subunit ClpB